VDLNNSETNDLRYYRSDRWVLVFCLVIAIFGTLDFIKREREVKMAIGLNSSNFEATINSADNQGKVLLVDFWAPWCGPCNALTPTIDQLNEEGYGVYKVNVEEESDLASEYSISSIPALVFFKDGKVVKKILGLQQKNQIEDTFKELEQ
jgi:thioredoxin 1